MQTNTQPKQKWFHAIGVCGKTTANIAKAFSDMGWFVTGSDMQYLPPASELLKQSNVHTVEGYDYRHLTREFWEKELRASSHELSIGEQPDLGLVMSFLTPKNKEYRYAKLHNIDIRPYAKVLSEYLIKENSIVVVGTAGKTTTTALATYVLEKLELNPSYMIGAEVANFEDSVRINDSKWSVIEGDEYHSPEIEGHAKFMEYKPKYLVITNIGWEHQDIFPTQESYINEFKKLVELVPTDGLIVAKANDENIDKALINARCKVVRYSIAKGELREGIWTISYEIDEHKLLGGHDYRISDNQGNEVFSGITNLIGEYNFENILAVGTLVSNIPEVKELLRSHMFSNFFEICVKEFKGAKKRLEVLYESEDVTVVDDFGVAPSRAKNSLKTLKDYYQDYKIIGVFEPNSGSRPKDLEIFNKIYKDAFTNADEIIIPDLSSFKDEFIDSQEMIKRLKDLNVNVTYVESEQLVSQLESRIKDKDTKVLVVFFSSYRLTQIAQKLVSSLNAAVSS